MIKIDRWFSPNIVHQYEKLMLKKIKKNYRSNGLSSLIRFYFEEDGCFSEQKVKALLVGKITKQQIQSFPNISERQRKKLEKFFSYKFLNNDNIRHELIASLGIQVCPYCNRQYITSWNNHGNTKTTADLDHYYPKAKYPLLALSLYNFIPSCQICNSRMKLSRTDEIVYPYEERFGDDAVFKVVLFNSKTEKINYIEMLHSLMGLKNSKINLNIEVDHQSAIADKIRNSINLFRLEEIYQSHESYIREILIKKRIYGDGTYLEMLNKQFSYLFNECGDEFSNFDLNLFMYGYNWKNGEDSDRPLSKLTYDIVMRG